MLHHPLTRTHECNGLHKQAGVLALHTCNCGATFYMLSDAVTALVGKYIEDMKWG